MYSSVFCSRRRTRRQIHASSPQGSWFLFLSIGYVFSHSSLLDVVLLVSLVGLSLCWGWRWLTSHHPHSFSLVLPAEHSVPISVRKCFVFSLMLIYCSSLFCSLTVMCLDVPCWVCKVSHNDREAVIWRNLTVVSYFGLHITNVSVSIIHLRTSKERAEVELNRNTQCQVSSQEFKDIWMSTVIVLWSWTLI